MSEFRETPIVPSEVFKLTFGDGEGEHLLICASHDSVQMFPDERLNHLRYYDNTTDELKAIWLDGDILTKLVEAGIPITLRETITEGEHECYKTYLGRLSMSCVEVEEVPEVHLTDAEIEYFWKEIE